MVEVELEIGFHDAFHFTAQALTVGFFKDVVCSTSLLMNTFAATFENSFPKGRISRYAWSILVRVWFRYCTVVTMTVERGTYRCGHSGSQRVRNYVISVVTFGMQPLVGQRLRLRMVRYKSYFLHPDCLGNL